MKINVITKVATVVALLFAFSLLTSCQSKEEKVISQMESLCKTVEKDSFDVKDIDALKAKFDAITEQAKDCDFTNEQLKEVAQLSARFTKDITKKALERVGSAVDGILEGLSGEE